MVFEPADYNRTMIGRSGPVGALAGRVARGWQVLREVLYGMALHEMVRYHVRNKAGLEHLFILITMGDLVGVPILPPYYSLRLLPYVVPELAGWKRRLLRERDLVDLLG
jgi:hypothetical protein